MLDIKSENANDVVSISILKKALSEYLMQYADDITKYLMQHHRAKNIYIGLDKGAVIKMATASHSMTAKIAFTNPCINQPNKQVADNLISNYIYQLDDYQLVDIMIQKLFVKNSSINNKFILWFIDNQPLDVADIFVKTVLSGHYQMIIDHLISNKVIISSLSREQMVRLLDILNSLNKYSNFENHLASLTILANLLNAAILKFNDYNNFYLRKFFEFCHTINFIGLKGKIEHMSDLQQYAENQTMSPIFIISQQVANEICKNDLLCEMLYSSKDINAIITAINNNNARFILNDAEPTLVVWNNYLKQAPAENDTIITAQKFLDCILQHNIQ